MGGYVARHREPDIRDRQRQRKVDPLWLVDYVMSRLGGEPVRMVGKLRVILP